MIQNGAIGHKMRGRKKEIEILAAYVWMGFHGKMSNRSAFFKLLAQLVPFSMKMIPYKQMPEAISDHYRFLATNQIYSIKIWKCSAKNRLARPKTLHFPIYVIFSSTVYMHISNKN